MAKRKTWLEKMNGKGDLPKRVLLDAESARRLGFREMLIPSPWDVRATMAKVPPGRVATVAELRSAMAKGAGVEGTCPMTTGIFAWIASNHAVEAGETDFPWWRTVKANGELIPRHPGGVEAQRRRLEAEGIGCVERKGRLFVENLERVLATL